MLHDLKRYVPTVYNGIQEMDNIISTEQEEIDTLCTEMKLAYNRQSVINADEKGIYLYEKILNISADENSESLDFRKERVIVQLTTSPPFSFNFLLQQLDKIAGIGNYKAWVDFNNYTLYIQSYISNKLWSNELNYLLAKIKPANILYVYIGYDKTTIGIKSKTEYYLAEWKYKLDGTWKLGEYPFYITYEGNWVYKLDGTWKLGEYAFYDRGEGVSLGLNNIKDYFKNNLAEYAKTLITDLIVNNEFVFNVEKFSYFNINNNLIEIEFIYSLAENSSEITNIKIRHEGNVLVEKDLYIAVSESVTVHLDIDIQEVLN